MVQPYVVGGATVCDGGCNRLQVVSPASPTYLHNLALSPEEIDYRQPPPFAAVGSAASGFTLLQVDLGRSSGCNHMGTTLQPYVNAVATVCKRGCNRIEDTL